MPADQQWEPRVRENNRQINELREQLIRLGRSSTYPVSTTGLSGLNWEQKYYQTWAELEWWRAQVQITNLTTDLTTRASERDARPNITIEQFNNDYSKRPTQQVYNSVISQRDARPNISLDSWNNDYSQRPTRQEYEQVRQEKGELERRLQSINQPLVQSQPSNSYSLEARRLLDRWEVYTRQISRTYNGVNYVFSANAYNNVYDEVQRDSSLLGKSPEFVSELSRQIANYPYQEVQYIINNPEHRVILEYSFQCVQQRVQQNQSQQAYIQY